LEARELKAERSKDRSWEGEKVRTMDKGRWMKKEKFFSPLRNTKLIQNSKLKIIK